MATPTTSEMSQSPAGNQPPPFVAVALRDIESELRRQFRADQDPGGPPIQWARLSNLVVSSDSPEQSAEAERAIHAIVLAHPARVIELRSNGEDGEGEISAEVHADTRYVSGKQEIATEHIRLKATGAATDRLPFVVRGLLIGDLPTNLWWASRRPPPLASTFLFELAEQADQVIFDSFGWPRPAEGLLATASWIEKFEDADGAVKRHRVASDLSWRRMKPWRRLLAQALDPSVAPGALDAIHAVEIEHGPNSVMAAIELVGWMGQALGWRPAGPARVERGKQAEWSLCAANGAAIGLTIRRVADAAPGLLRARIAFANSALVFTPDDANRRLTVDVENSGLAPRTTAASTRPLAELIVQQLSDRERDPVFRKSVAFAQTLARGLLGRG